MNVTFISTAHPPSTGGAQLLQHKLANYLQANGNGVEVFSLWNSVRSDWLLGTTVRAHSQIKNYAIDDVVVNRIGLNLGNKVELGALSIGYYPFMKSVVPKMANVYQSVIDPFNINPDIVHSVRMGRVPISYAGFQIAREHGVPFVLTPVHHTHWIGRRYRAWLELYRAADGVITLTHSEKDILAGLGVEPDKIYVTGMGPVLAQTASAERFREKYNIGEDSPIVLFLAQHRPYKGYQQLLEATTKVWEKHEKTQFIFAGPEIGNSESFFDGVDSRVCRVGAVDIQTKTDALAACDVMCLPSTQESFGGVYTEAWWFRKPVIGCDIPAVSEVIDHEVNGLLCGQSVEDIAKSICRLLADLEESQKMGQNGREKVEKLYTWEQLGKKTTEVYQCIIEQFEGQRKI